MSSVSGVNSALASTANPSTINVSNLLASLTGATTPGIDVNTAVAAAIFAERGSERNWQSQQATLTAQTTTLTSIQTAATALNTDLQALNSLNGPLASRSVSSSNSNLVSASAAAGTPAGNHSIVINNLASTASWYSDLAATPTTVLPAESFTITTAAGPSTTINVGTGTVHTLADIAASINGGSGLGYTANVVSDSTGSRLAIVSVTSGSSSDFTVTSAPTTTTSWLAPAVASATVGLSANTFTITNGGPPATITVTAGETLAQVSTDINGQNLGVTASVAHDTAGYHLSIVSGDGVTPFTISLPAFGFSQAAIGANASLNVDGVPVSSASNTVTGAIGGVTLNLYGQTGGAQLQLTVGSNTAQVSTAIQSLVTDYNSAITQVNAQFLFSTTSGSQGSLGSDPTIRELQSSLLSAVSYTNTGTTTIPSLSSLGITINNDGTLAVNSAALTSAITSSPNDVQAFFQGASLNGFANSVQNHISSFTAPANGAFTVELNSLSKESQSLTDQINSFETNYIAKQQVILTALYSKAEIALQQLPSKSAQLQAELGNNTKTG